MATKTRGAHRLGHGAAGCAWHGWGSQNIREPAREGAWRAGRRAVMTMFPTPSAASG